MVTASSVGERGQLILVGALLLSVTIVGSIVLLNALHESPNVYTQQESQSLEDAERAVAEVRDNLERVFLVNSSVDQVGEPLPYANDSSFDRLVAEYERQYANLSTIHGAGLVQIEVVGGETGGVARQGPAPGGYHAYPNGTVIEGASAIPQLNLEINDTNGGPFTVEIRGDTGSSVEMVINDSGVSGAVSCSLDDFDSISIHLSKGSGSVSTEETYCGVENFGAGLSQPLTVEMDNPGGADGTYTVTGVGATSPEVTGSPNEDNPWSINSTGSQDYLVNPEFEIQYRNPDLSFTTTFELYNRSGP